MAKKSRGVILGMILLVYSLFVSAQKNTWTLGISSGVRGEVITYESQFYDVEYDEDDSFASYEIKSFISRPPVMLNVSYNITDNFSVSSGITFLQYLTKWEDISSGYTTDEELAFREKISYTRNTLQIPLTVCYDIPVRNTGLSFFAKSGVCMDISIHKGNFIIDSDSKVFPIEMFDGNIYDLYSIAYRICPRNDRNLNLIINAGIGFAYKFKSGLGLSLSGEYNIGLFRLDVLNFYSQIKEKGTDILKYKHTCRFINRNEYWNVLFGISYTFKQKKKE